MDYDAQMKPASSEATTFEVLDNQLRNISRKFTEEFGSREGAAAP
jgi:hypothetical protein